MWSLIIFLVFKDLVSARFGPHTPTGGCGGACPTIIVVEGATIDVRAPLVRVRGQRPRKDFFYEKCLVKYCNFIVNLDHSLCHRFDGRSYVNLRVFCSRRQPSIIYEGIVLRLCIIF